MSHLDVFNLTDAVLANVSTERLRQNSKWGVQNHPIIHEDDYLSVGLYRDEERDWQEMNARRNENGALAWDGILLEEVYEALSEEDPQKQYEELVQVAAVASAMAECLIRKGLAKVS